MNWKKIVIFGAGKIGRSFIGQVFSRSGYETVFVDINRQLIDLLNQRQQYQVVIKGDIYEPPLIIRSVRGIYLEDTEQVIAELTDAGIAALSVGQQGLQAAIPVLAKALLVRRQKHDNTPLDIIIAENMRNADIFIRDELRKWLPENDWLDLSVGLIETSIGKMVPIMTQKDIEDDPLQVFAEPYNTLIVAKNSFRNPLPDVPYLAPKENIKAWVDRKLFIHNLGHATAAYLGFKNHPDAVYIWEVLDEPEIYRSTRETMLQAANVLRTLYPDEFTPSQLEEHIDDLLRRFMNKSLGDTIFRVGCDLYRKLGRDDRLVAPIQAAIRVGMPYHLIMEAIIAGISFRAKDENGNYLPSDEAFFVEAQKGTQYIIEHVCRINKTVLIQ